MHKTLRKDAIITLGCWYVICSAPPDNKQTFLGAKSPGICKEKNCQNNEPYSEMTVQKKHIQGEREFKEIGFS